MCLKLFVLFFEGLMPEILTFCGGGNPKKQTLLQRTGAALQRTGGAVARAGGALDDMGCVAED